MELSELLQVAGRVGPTILGVATIATAFLYFANVIRKFYKVTARARRVERERDEAVRLKEEAEHSLDRLAGENAKSRSEAEKANGTIEWYKRETDKLWKDVVKFFNAGRKEYLRRCQLEEAAKETDEELGKTRGELEIARAELKLRSATVDTQRKDLERYEAQIDAVAKQDGRVWCARPVAAPPRFVPQAERRSQRPTIISLLNLKGGVGKTTITANLGSYLAYHRDKWVLLLDLDHQRSLTQMVFTTEKRKDIAASRRTIQDYLHPDADGKDFLRFAEQVQGNGYSRLWVVGNADAEEGYGNTQNLDDLEMDLLGQWLLNPEKCDIRYLLRAALHSQAIQERYDYVLIDCPPRLTTACINALAASDYVLIPTQAEPISASSVSHLLRRLRTLREAGVIPDLRVLGVVGNMVSADADDPKSREVKLLEQTVAAASTLWGKPVQLLKSRIRDSDNYARYQRDSEGKRRIQLPAVSVGAIREQYQKLTNEMEERFHESLGIAGVPA